MVLWAEWWIQMHIPPHWLDLFQPIEFSAAGQDSGGKRTNFREPTSVAISRLAIGSSERARSPTPVLVLYFTTTATVLVFYLSLSVHTVPAFRFLVPLEPRPMDRATPAPVGQVPLGFACVPGCRGCCQLRCLLLIVIC